MATDRSLSTLDLYSQSSIYHDNVSKKPIINEIYTSNTPTSHVSPLAQNTLKNSIPATIEELLKRRNILHTQITNLQSNAGKKISKVYEPARNKTHYDYFLDEMCWLAKDFARERKWKISLAKKVVRQCSVKQHKFKTKVGRKIREDEIHRKRLAATVSRLIKSFWVKIHKIILLKQKNVSKLIKKKQINENLNQLVDKTEQYTSSLIGTFTKAQVNDDIIQFKHELEVLDNPELLYDEIESDEDDQDVLIEELDENEDDENTLIEEEKITSPSEIKQELHDLIEDQKLSVEELHQLYGTTHLLEKDSLEDEESNSSEDEEAPASDYEHEWGSHLFQPQQEKRRKTTASRDELKLNAATSAAKSAQPKGTTLVETHVSMKSPSLLRFGTLREYQIIGLQWLDSLYGNNLNGILADEMGLGKTIMTISLLAHLASEKQIWGPHLIVVPSSVILNWEIEFKRWLPGFIVLAYYGSAKERRIKRQGWSKPDSFNICITSYQLLVHDAVSFKRIKWHYLIVDEAQNIKNYKSQRWITLLSLHSSRRLLLTGTPLQNNLMELWSLMHFLMPHVFSSSTEFHQWFNSPITNMIEGKETVNKALIERLHNVLRPFVLRRLKDDVEQQLPKKFEHIVTSYLSKKQRQLYDELLTLRDEADEEVKKRNSYFGLMNTLMQLRKVCNHPLLFEGYTSSRSSFVSSQINFVAPSEIFNIFENDLFSSTFLHFFNESLISTEDVFEISKLRLDSKKILSLDTNTPSFSASFSSVLNDANKRTISTIQKYHSQLLNRIKEHSQESLSSLAYINELHCDKSLNTRIHFNTLRILTLTPPSILLSNSQPFLTDIPPLIQSPSYRLSSMDIIPISTRYIEPVIALPIQLFISHPYNHFPEVPFSADSFHSELTKAYDMVSSLSTVSRPLISYEDIAIHASDNQQVYRYLYWHHHNRFLQLGDYYQIEYDSGKLMTLANLLSKLYQNHHRAILFTQMTKMLDILEVFINHHRWKYYRLDGGVSLEHRQRLIEDFNVNKNIFLFIMSTRAGGLGINLTGADTVIFFDTDWNPQIDLQAQDRCHRIGQVHEVHIYRIITSATIEENIYNRSRQKMIMMKMIMNDANYQPSAMLENDEKKNSESLFASFNSIAQLKSLIYNEPETVVQEENAHSPEEIQTLMKKVEDSSDNLHHHLTVEDAKIIADGDKNIHSSLYPIERFCLDLMENNKIEYMLFSDVVDDNTMKTAVLEEQLFREEFKLNKDQHLDDIDQPRTRKLPPPGQEDDDSCLTIHGSSKLSNATLVGSSVSSTFSKAKPPISHFFSILAGNSNDSVHAMLHPLLLNFERYGYYVSVTASFKLDDEAVPVVFNHFQPKFLNYEEDEYDDINNEICLFSSATSLSRMIPIRKPKPAPVPTVTVTSEGNSQLTVRIPRAKITKAYRSHAPQASSMNKQPPIQPIKRRHPLLWTTDEDNLIVSLFKQFESNTLLIAFLLNDDVHCKGRLRTPEDISTRFQVLQAHPTPADRDMLYRQETTKKKKKNKKDSFTCNAPISLGVPTVFHFMNDAMKRINTERQQCKDALRQSLTTTTDENLTRAILQIAHTSHKKTLNDAQVRIGLSPALVGKVLAPVEIADYQLSKLFNTPLPSSFGTFSQPSTPMLTPVIPHSSQNIHQHSHTHSVSNTTATNNNNAGLNVNQQSLKSDPLIATIESLLSSSQNSLPVPSQYLNQLLLTSPQFRTSLFELLSNNSSTQKQKIEGIFQLLKFHQTNSQIPRNK